MEIIEPSYYRAFHCLAADCPDSCCKEWDIEIDAPSALRYRALPGALGEQLRACLSDTECGTVMLQSDGRCPMWRSDGLCQIQTQLGADALCDVCATYPRLRHDYGSFVELGLELSCPEAARLILTSPDAPDVIRTEPGGDPPEYDLAAMRILRRTRAEVLAFLRGSEYPLDEALAVALLYAHAVQNELDGGEEAVLSPQDMLSSARSLAQNASDSAFIAFYSELEILTDAWRTRLSSPSPAPWSTPLRKFACYGITRYWLQAVSDFDLIGRAKLVIAACILVRLLGGDPVATAQLYAKEIENDADNVDAILDAAYTSHALSDRTLLGLLFG